MGAASSGDRSEGEELCEDNLDKNSQFCNIFIFRFLTFPLSTFLESNTF